MAVGGQSAVVIVIVVGLLVLCREYGVAPVTLGLVALEASSLLPAREGGGSCSVLGLTGIGFFCGCFALVVSWTSRIDVL